jgi:hypothetical protein
LSITSNKGNTITRIGEPEDPAVHVERQGNDVAKKAHELNIEEPAEKAGAKETNGHHESEEKPKESEGKEVTALSAPSVVSHAAEKWGVPEEDVAPSAPGETENSLQSEEDAGAQPLSATNVSQKGEKRAASPEDPDDVDVANGHEESASTAPKAPAKMQEPASKKQKTQGKGKEDSVDKKSRGRKKSTTKREPKQASTTDGKPRRSARLGA